MTDVRQVIARQIDRSGSTLLLAMEPLDDGEFFAENANGFSAAWVTGHLACVADLFSSWASGRVLLDCRFHRVFNETAIDPGMAGPGPLSKAEIARREGHPKAALLLQFRRAVIKALRTLDEFDITEWDAAPAGIVPVSLLTWGAMWEHLAVHIYWHLGELAGSMPRFYGTYTLNILPHHLYVPPG